MNPLRTTVARTALALTAVALFAASRLALAQPLPSAKELMDKHDAAIGGRAALDKHTSVHQTGAVSIPAMGVEATMDVYRAKPALFLQKLVIGPMGEILQGFDGKTAWAVQAGQPVVLEGAQAGMTKYNSDFFGNFHDMKRYKVRIVRNIGGEGFEFFDAATGLGAGIIVSSESPMGKVETTSVFAEYKDFDGLKFPTKITQKTPMFESTITIKTMEFDKVAPETFALPDAVKALVKPPAP